MQVTTCRDDQSIAQLFAQLISYSQHSCKIEGVFGAGMWRAYNVRNPVGNGIFGHRQRILYGSRSVVETE
jgi:hypothetical protein